MTGPAKKGSIWDSILKKDYEKLESLLLKGGSPNKCKDTGTAPLHYAVWNNEPELMEIVLRFKADPNKKVVNGMTPLHLAVIRGDCEKIRRLLKAGANPSITNDTGHLPIECTASSEVHALIQEHTRRIILGAIKSQKKTPKKDGHGSPEML
jgi:hypothetical protein